MIKSIKVMLLPNDKQATKLFQNANAAKYAYNWTVALQMETFTQTGKYLPEGDTRKLFTQHKQEKPWLYEASNNAAKQAIKDCCDAFWRFIAEKMKLGYKPYSSNQIRQSQQNNRLLTRYEMCHHPKYKRKGIAKPKFYADTEKTRFSDTHVKLEMIAESKRKNRAKANWIKLAEDRRIPTDAKYTNPRVSFDGLHWWISVGIDTNQEITQLSPEGLGIDLGLKELAISSDGSRLRNINKEPAIRKLKKKQRRLQRQVSRKYQMNKEGESYRKTSNIIKSEQRLLQINQRLANIRHNYVQQETTGMVKQKTTLRLYGRSEHKRSDEEQALSKINSGAMLGRTLPPDQIQM